MNIYDYDLRHRNIWRINMDAVHKLGGKINDSVELWALV